MAQYFRVSPQIWSESWDDDTRQMAFYVLTSPHRKTEGLYRLPLGYIREDIKWTEKRIRAALASLIADEFIDYDESAGVVLILKALKWQAPKNPNMANKAASVLETVPETKLDTKFGELAQQYSEQLWIVLQERFGDRFGEPLALAPTQAPSPSSTVGDEDVETNELRTELLKSFDANDVDAALQKLDDRERFGGEAIKSRKSWASSVCADLAAARMVASRNGQPARAEVGDEVWERQSDGTWEPIDA